MVGLSIARRIRSGTLVGPGICRKCRPLGCEFRRMEFIPSVILTCILYTTCETESSPMDGITLPIARSSLPEAAAERLRTLIIEGELAPGSRLNEREL